MSLLSLLLNKNIHLLKKKKRKEITDPELLNGNVYIESVVHSQLCELG